MSDPLRVALVAEGPTDGVVIEAALRAMLDGHSFVLNQLQPEGSLAFGELGTGWVGVYRWCHQAAKRGKGQLGNDALVFQNYDLLILHLDADVAGERYANGSITPQDNDGGLPCERPCPPASDTTNALRSVLLSWCGEAKTPSRTVLCVPSKNTEAWVVESLFPNNRPIAAGSAECRQKPETLLGQQPKSKRIRKNRRDYETRANDLEEAWTRIAAPGVIGEACRFQPEFLETLQTTQG